MIVTLLTQPNTLNPIDTPIWYTAGSTWVQVDDFKFNWKIDDLDKFNPTIVNVDYGVYQTPPNPSLLGVFSPHEVIKTGIGFKYITDLQSYTYSQDDWMRLRVRYGFDTKLSLPYYDELFAGGNISLTFSYQHNLQNGMQIQLETESTVNPEYNGAIGTITSIPNIYAVNTNIPFLNSGPAIGGKVRITYYDAFNASGYLGLTFSGTHLFQVGDYVTVNKTDKTLNKQYDGEWLVLATASNSIIVDKSYGFSYSAGQDGGLIDRLSRLEGASNNSVAIKGVRYYDEVNRNFTNDYYISLSTPGTYSFLTEYTEYKAIPSGQYETVRGFVLPGSISHLVLKKWYADGTSATQQITFSAGIGTTPMIFHFGIGTPNILQTFGPTSLDNAVKYEIYLTNTVTNTVSAKREIKDFCSIYPLEKILFLNRLGSFETFYFNRKQKRKLNIGRNNYKKPLAYNYQIGDRGMTTYSLKVTEEYTFNTDFLSEYEADFLEQLLTTCEAFWLQENGNKIPINIINKDWESKYDINGEQFSLELVFNPSYDINTISQ